MKKIRFLSLLLALCLLLSAFSTGFVSASEVKVEQVGAEVETAETNANLYGLAENIQQGQILQCWNWSYKNIEANLQKIAEQGFSVIQTSPIQPIKEQTTEYWNTVMNSSWVIYQPVAFNIEDNYRNVQGTKTEFKSMCEAAHKYGVKVICDVVFNHMANDMSGNTIHPWVPSDIKDNPDCWHDISKNISNFENRYDTTQYCLTGLPDLNTANSTVQWHCTNLLKEAIEAGADGFRFDAAKHIETPSDSSSVRSDFWPNVLGAATEFAQSTRNFTPYYYGEILGSPGGGLSITAYTQYMSVTDPGSSDTIRDGVCNGDAAKAATGSVSCGAAKDKAVQWTESHDNHKDNGTNFISSENINKTWAMVGAKSEICGVYLARPENMETTMMGDADQTSWTYPAVKAVNRFNNAFVGQSEYLSSYNSLACIERGNSGMIIVNTGGSYYDGMKAPVHTMSSGTYTDAITGNTFKVSGGYISGDIGDTGIAVVYNVDANGPFSYGNVTDFAVAGSFNGWNTSANKMVAMSANKATTSMYIPAGTYTFKVTANGLWYGNSGTIEDTTGDSGWTMKTAKDDNCTLVATGGKYNFTFDITTGKLVVEHVSTTSRDSEYYLKGSFNSWEGTTPLAFDEGTNTVSANVQLSAGTHTFKINNSRVGSWYSNAGTIDNETGEGGWTMKTTVEDNCTLTAEGGTYRFTLNPSTMKLVIEQIADLSGTVSHTVTFANYDGTILSVQKVEDGKSATAPAAPTRPKTAKHTYTFSGWDTAFTNVKSDITVTATYTQTVNKYTVTFLDWDESVISTQQVEYGTAATVPPIMPEREGYTFTGWDKDFSNITGDLTVTAQYSDTATYLKGTFNDWSQDNPMVFSGESNVLTTTLKLEAGTYKFKIHSQDVWYGNDGTIEDTTAVTSSSGWTFRTGKGNCTLNATGGTYLFTYNLSTNQVKVLKASNEYTVVFKNYDGTVLSTQTVEEGKAATAPSAPTRKADAQYSYAFKEWDRDFSNITADTTVTALYTKTLNKYTVTFKDWDGTVLSAVHVEYGKGATAPSAPTREADTQYTYTFKEWDKTFSRITADTTVTAVYTQTLNKYTVTFKDYDGTALSTQQVEYGNAATAPESPQRDGYTFSSWDTDFSNVTADITVNAVYTKNPVAVALGSLRVRVAGGTGFTISVDGGTARPQGATYLNSKLPMGTEVTVTAFSNSSAEFVAWVNPMTGAVVTDELSYNFISSGNDSLNAVFKVEVEGVKTVTFMNDKVGTYGRVLDSQYYSSTESVVYPSTPTQVGYDFAGWSMTESEIQSAIANGEDVTVTAKWTRAVVPVQVTVNGGEGSGTYNANSAVTVTANAPAEGEKFAYWTDAQGNVKSYSEEYKFYPSTDTEVTAVFVSEDTEINYQVLVSLDSIDTTTVEGKNVFYYSWYCPDTYTFVKAGIVAVNKDNYNEETFVAGSSDSNVFDRSPSGSNLIPVNTFTWSKSNVTSGQTWMAKAYVQYRDADGTIVTVYSSVVEATKD